MPITTAEILVLVFCILYLVLAWIRDKREQKKKYISVREIMVERVKKGGSK